MSCSAVEHRSTRERSWNVVQALSYSLPCNIQWLFRGDRWNLINNSSVWEDCAGSGAYSSKKIREQNTSGTVINTRNSFSVNDKNAKGVLADNSHQRLNLNSSGAELPEARRYIGVIFRENSKGETPPSFRFNGRVAFKKKHGRSVFNSSLPTS